MAKTTIAGKSYVITSAISMADMEMVKKYRPSALELTEPDTKEPFFKVDIGSGSVSNVGICFDGISNDGEKLATVTLSIPHDVENAKEHVLDKAGLALANLEKVEAGITAVLDNIRTMRDGIAGKITVSA